MLETAGAKLPGDVAEVPVHVGIPGIELGEPLGDRLPPPAQLDRCVIKRLAEAELILGLGRALGETMAVTMLIGNRHEISASLFAPGYTMASLIATTGPGPVWPAWGVQIHRWTSPSEC